MNYNIGIDADSLIYKSCSRCQTEDGVNLEQAYFEFCGEIAKICSELFIRGTDGKIGLMVYAKGDSVTPHIVLSPRKSFRNRLRPNGVNFRINKLGNKVDLGYKANRTKPTIAGIRELKRLVVSRLDNVYIDAEAEADDIINWMSREKNWMIAAIDKDVINSSRTFCYNYNKREWIAPKDDLDIERWYLYQTILGDRDDNILGVEGVGKVGAKKIMQELGDDVKFMDITQYFDSINDAYITHLLVRMDMYDGEKIVLKTLDELK